MAGLETDVVLLKKEVKDMKLIHTRLDTAIVKITDVSNSIHRMLAVHEEKLSKQEAKMDWQLDAAQLERNIRAFNPWPVAFFNVEETNVKVYGAEVIQTDNQSTQPGEILCADKSGVLIATGNGNLLLKTLQMPGKKPLSASDILNGRADWFAVGKVLP